jgi:predicted CopG family antitoxin
MASTNITLSQPAYERLKKLKTHGESFSDVILRELPERANTAGELLELTERDEPPRFDEEMLEKVTKDRKRRSNRRA